MTSSLFPAIRAAENGLEFAPAGWIFTVDGTVYPGAPAPPVPAFDNGVGGWAGFASGMVAGLANAQDGLWASACIGYPASVIPMGPSVTAGVVSLATSVEYATQLYYSQHGTFEGLALIFSGYSQGAMVVASYWTNYILNPLGAHSHLAPYVYRLYQYGDPYRTPGIAHGNALAGLSESITTDGVETGGIGGKLDLPPAISNILAPDGRYVYNSCANKGDIYTACPTGLDPWNNIAGAGKAGNLIFTEVQNLSLVNTLKIATALGSPIGVIEELINGMVFMAQGTSAPHWNYWTQMDACIQDALELGNSLPHKGC